MATNYGWRRVCLCAACPSSAPNAKRPTSPPKHGQKCGVGCAECDGNTQQCVVCKAGYVLADLAGGPDCTLQVCNGQSPFLCREPYDLVLCGSGEGAFDCGCFATTESGSQCLENEFCNTLQPCTSSLDCGAGEFCNIASCCGGGVCSKLCNAPYTANAQSLRNNASTAAPTAFPTMSWPDKAAWAASTTRGQAAVPAVVVAPSPAQP